MAKKVRKNVNRALNLLNDFQPDKYEKVQRKEDLIDKYETKLGMYLMKLTKKEMTSSQTRHVSLYLSTISDFERIGDHAAGIAHMSNEMHEQHTGFSGAAWDELNVVMEAVREIINVTCRVFLDEDTEEAKKVAPLGVVITDLCENLKHSHVIRLSNGTCGLEQGAVFNDLLNSFSRIAAHCAGVVVALLKSGEKGDDLHIHDSRVYAGDGREYQEYYAEYRKKYDIAVSESHMRSMEPEEVE